MPQLLAHRAAVRVAQFAIAAAGILFVLLLFSRQAHAATGDDPPPAPSAVASAVSALTGPALVRGPGWFPRRHLRLERLVSSVVGTVTKPVTAAVTTVTQAASASSQAASTSPVRRRPSRRHQTRGHLVPGR